MAEATGAVNGVMGDADSPTTLPVTEVPEEVLVDEKKMAEYSKTDEFKRLSKFLQARVQFYQRYLPNGTMVEGDPQDAQKLKYPEAINPEHLGAYWMAACIVVKEFERVLAEYELAAQVVKEHEQQ